MFASRLTLLVSEVVGYRLSGQSRSMFVHRGTRVARFICQGRYTYFLIDREDEAM